MTLRFGLAFVGFLGAFSLVFSGCGDDESSDDGSPKGGKGGSNAGEGGETTGGVSGTTGTGGNAGRGGTTGTGGRGGTAGAGGRGGTAGAGGTGGTDATGGLSGDAGGGPIGGEGGESGAGAGGAGNAGEAGAGGVPDMTANACRYQCQGDEECARGTDDSYKCHPTRKRCENPDFICDSHDDCVAMASLWTVACADDNGCDPIFAEVCVDVGGRGRCAMTPDIALGCFLGGAESTFPKFGSTGDAVVCASADGRCNDQGACFRGCSDSPCGACLMCNATTGLCECDADGECSAAGVSRCNMTTHLCECATDTDCTLSGTNKCVNGRCGCASTMICSATLFPNATPVCE
jgi:hypothetical protein